MLIGLEARGDSWSAIFHCLKIFTAGADYKGYRQSAGSWPEGVRI